jgi:hypothetical protein
VSAKRALGATPALLAVILAGACAKSEERPPPPVCAGECGRPTNVRIGVPTSPGGGGESGEVPGDGGENSSDTVTLTGNVQLLFDNGRFDTGEIFGDAAVIKSTRADGQTSSDTWTGTPPYTVEELPAQSTVWLLVTPQTAGADAEVTLEPVLTEHADAKGFVTADLGIVRESNIETLFDLLSVPIQRDASAAQVVLRLVARGAGSGLTPLSGVIVKATSAEGITYGASGSYSDVATATDTTGVAVLLNVPAGGWPGALVSVQFSGAKTGGAEVRAVGGAVSLVTLLL